MTPARTPIDHGQRETSRAMIPQKRFTPAPRRPSDIGELRRLEEVERRLAQEYHMAFEGVCIDSTAVRQEAKRRASESATRMLPSVIRGLFQSNAPSMSNDTADLHNLYHLRTRLAENQIMVKSYPYHASRFWAVVIGIDAYKLNCLDGCVSDALSMKKLLIDKLEVPEHRIQCLLGSKNSSFSDDPFLTPSRANIVDTLVHLIDHPEIARGDNIIIYYAGHGSSYRCLEHLGTESCTSTASMDSLPVLSCEMGICPIEALCPIDRDTQDANNVWIPDISDRELDALFTQISYTKGHKITFIADCCYSGGVSRAPEPETRLRCTRTAVKSDIDAMFRAADERLGYLPRYKSVRSDVWQEDPSSHVVLAACGDYQIVRETPVGKQYGGDFTRQLTNVLGSDDWKEDTTYVDLAKLLNGSYFQTPVVAGEHINQRVWFQDSP